jgi:ribosomal protein L21
MPKYAIVQIGGKQSLIREGDMVNFSLLPLWGRTRAPFSVGDSFYLNQLLCVNLESKLKIGQPFIDDYAYQIKVVVLRHVASSKLNVYKMKSKKKTRKIYGNRCKFTRLVIKSIGFLSH